MFKICILPAKKNKNKINKKNNKLKEVSNDYYGYVYVIKITEHQICILIMWHWSNYCIKFSFAITGINDIYNILK